MKKFLLTAVAIGALAPAMASAQTVVSRSSAVRGEQGVVQVPTTDASVAKIEAVVTVNPTTGAAVTPSDATAANQTSQIAQETAINTVLGAVTASPTANTISDRLKTLHDDLGLGATAANQTTVITNLGTLHNDLTGTLTFTNRSVLVKDTIANGTGLYTAGSNIGGLVPISGLPVSTNLLTCQILVKANIGITTTNGGLEFLLFDSNPTGSTFTDNVTVAIANADMPKLGLVTNVTSSSFGVVGAPVQWATAAPGSAAACPQVKTDSGGRVYLSIAPNTTIQWSAGTALYLTFRATY